jgi:DNA-directed RNA polymerase subunit RPC12/RpoP
MVKDKGKEGNQKKCIECGAKVKSIGGDCYRCPACGKKQ